MVNDARCPRCDGQLIGWTDADISCLQCGHVPYQNVLTTLGLELPNESGERAQETTRSGKPK